jgi:membrane associated rhomboid family serine protease
MTPTPVGMRCPDCSKQTTQVRTAAHVAAGSEPQVTIALIALCVMAFVANGNFGFDASGPLIDRGALDPFDVADGDWWRLVTYGFLHAGLIHIGFNMYLLYLLGRMLEPEVGSLRFALVYFTCLVFGALGSFLYNGGSGVGASGAVFGLMGFAAVELRARGIDVWRSEIGTLILVNLGLTFLLSGVVSVGGHVGGLIGGVLCGAVWQVTQRSRRPAVFLVVCAFLLVGAAAAAIAYAPEPGLIDPRY